MPLDKVFSEGELEELGAKTDELIIKAIDDRNTDEAKILSAACIKSAWRCMT